jgi:hypothetical protein
MSSGNVDSFLSSISFRFPKFPKVCPVSEDFDTMLRIQSQQSSIDHRSRPTPTHLPGRLSIQSESSQPVCKTSPSQPSAWNSHIQIQNSVICKSYHSDCSCITNTRLKEEYFQVTVPLNPHRTLPPERCPIPGSVLPLISASEWSPQSANVTCVNSQPSEKCCQSVNAGREDREVQNHVSTMLSPAW